MSHGYFVISAQVLKVGKLPYMYTNFSHVYWPFVLLLTAYLRITLVNVYSKDIFNIVVPLQLYLQCNFNYSVEFKSS